MVASITSTLNSFQVVPGPDHRSLKQAPFSACYKSQRMSLVCTSIVIWFLFSMHPFETGASVCPFLLKFTIAWVRDFVSPFLVPHAKVHTPTSSSESLYPNASHTKFSTHKKGILLGYGLMTSILHNF